MNHIAIRREYRNRWERCTPLVPDDVVDLVVEGIRLTVQSSSIRAHSDKAFETAGASVGDLIDDVDLIMGIRELPAEAINQSAAWLMFSHTSEGQAQNMRMLRRLMETKSTLLDYALIANEEGEHLVMFGHHAEESSTAETFSTEESLELSSHLSRDLCPFIPSLARASLEAASVAESGLPKILQRACILWRGRLTGPFSKLAVPLEKYGNTE